MQNNMEQHNQNTQSFKKKRRSEHVKRKKHSSHLFLWIFLGILLCAGGYFYYQYNAIKTFVEPYQNVYLPNITIDGISLSNMTKEQAQQKVFEHVNNRQNSFSLSLTSNTHTFFTFDYQTLGIVTDETAVQNLLDQAYVYGHRGDLKAQKAEIEQFQKEGLTLYTTQSEMTDTNVDAVLAQIASFYEKSPVDAYLVSFNPDLPDPFYIQPEIYGETLDIQKYKEEILQRVSEGKSGTLELMPTPVAPKVLTKDVRNSVSLLSEGVTAIATTSEYGRNENIKIASAKINGKILEPGDRFSFNSVVGKRTIANGFKEAPEYAYGELVSGIGGGVCQVSSTIYIAAVTSGQEIVDRRKHSSPVNYTEKGQDATVSDNRIDFVFKNDSDSNIYITAHVEKVPRTKSRMQCVVRMYGQSLGESVTLKLKSNVTEVLQPDPMPIYEKDTKAKHVTFTDETHVKQKAKEGSVVETYLQRYENNTLVSETLISTDRYEPKQEVLYIGVTPR